MITEAMRLCESPNTFYCDQLRNRDAADGYRPLGEEIWLQTEGRVDTFVQVVGTSHSLQGVASVLRPRQVRIVAVEPAECPVISGGKAGGHRIEGIGPGFVPPLWRDGVADEILTVSTEEAEERLTACRPLGRAIAKP